MRTPLSVLRTDDGAMEPETELAVVDVYAGRVLIELDDGTRLNLDAVELRHAIEPEDLAA